MEFDIMKTEGTGGTPEQLYTKNIASSKIVGKVILFDDKSLPLELPVKPANGDIVKTIKDFFDNYLYDVDNCYEINKINHKKTGNISFAALVLLQAKEKLLSRLSV